MPRNLSSTPSTPSSSTGNRFTLKFFVKSGVETAEEETEEEATEGVVVVAKEVDGMVGVLDVAISREKREALLFLADKSRGCEDPRLYFDAERFRDSFSSATRECRTWTWNEEVEHHGTIFQVEHHIKCN